MKLSMPSLAKAAAVFGVLAMGHSAGAQTYYGTAQAAPQATPQTGGCYGGGGCNASSACYTNIPTDTAVVPNPHIPEGHPGSQSNPIKILNGCPEKVGDYTVTHYYYKWYTIENVKVPYDEIHYYQKPLHKVCKADAPCPACVAAGGYGKGEHAGTAKSEQEVLEMNRTADAAPAPAPVAGPVPAPVPALAGAPAAVASTPAKQWILVTDKQMYGFGYINAQGYAVIDPGSLRQTLPTTPADATVASAR